MTREEIDTAWSRALGEAVKEGEQFTRYHFAAIIRAQALEEAAVHFDQLALCNGGHLSPGFYEPQEPAEILRSLKGQP